LKPTANLHHLRPDQYDNLEPEAFVCLNAQSHEIVEWFARKKDWRDCLERLAAILEKMEPAE
jgi:hypothetical protein